MKKKAPPKILAPSASMLVRRNTRGRITNVKIEMVDDNGTATFDFTPLSFAIFAGDIIKTANLQLHGTRSKKRWVLA